MPAPSRALPRFIVSGASGDAGKTTISLGLIRAARARGLTVHAFKKGPDFIDPAWLGRAAGRPARNLDVRLCGEDHVRSLFLTHAGPADLSVIEGNRGLFDGGDAQGTHSTASLARLLDAPVLLVVNAAKVTRTVAAVVMGCKVLEPDFHLAGVVLNRIAGDRHRSVTTRAIEDSTGIPVVGALPRSEVKSIPSRHLGLLTPQEHHAADCVLDDVERLVTDHVDVDRVLSIADSASPFPEAPVPEPRCETSAPEQGLVRIGVLMDSAFTFYYPDNLEALERAGGRCVPISPLRDRGLPPLDVLYVGGGFPETHASALAANRDLMGSIREAVEGGLLVYAECGGLMYVSRRLHTAAGDHEMVGLLPIETAMQATTVGHGYVEAEVVGKNAFYEVGTRVVGHEFHYSRVVSGWEDADLVFAMRRGRGVREGREGLSLGGVLATYVHVHALGMESWVQGMITAGRESRSQRESSR